MKFFTISNENQTTAHATINAARKTEQQVIRDAGALDICLHDEPQTRLVAIWNNLPGVTPVKKFNTRANALRRIWEHMQTLEPTAAPEIEEHTAAQAIAAKTPREGSKRALIISLIGRPKGATRTELCEATGWKPAFTDGFIAWTVKKTFALPVVSTKGADGERTYTLQS